MAHLPLQVAPTLLCGLTQPRLPAPEVAEWTGSSLLHRSSWSVSAQFCHPESVFFPRAEAQQGCPASGPPFPCPLPWALAANSHGRARLVFRGLPLAWLEAPTVHFWPPAWALSSAALPLLELRPHGCLARRGRKPGPWGCWWFGGCGQTAVSRQFLGSATLLSPRGPEDGG